MSNARRRFTPRNPIAPPAPIALPTDSAQDPNAPAPPNPLHSILDAIAPESNIFANEGDAFNLDVVPDHRFPLISWLYSISRQATPSTYSNHPCASPSSLIGYTYAIYIALLFQNDACLRQHASSHARDVMQNPYLKQFFDSFLDLPVPSFATLDFEALRFFNHERASNLVSIGSLAGFSFMHDFGRFFTTGTFFGLHDLLARVPGNTPLSTAQYKFARLPVATVVLSNNAVVTITPGHLFGLVQNDIVYSNWLNTRLTSILNQAEIRSMASRPNAGTHPMFAIPQTNVNDINPYLFMMSISEDNLQVLESWIRSLASFVSESFPSSKPLRAYTQVGSDEVLRHLTFELPPPTWHARELGNLLNPIEPPNNQPFLNAQQHTHAEFAAALEFRQHDSLPNPTSPPQTSAPITVPPNSWVPDILTPDDQLPVDNPHPARPLTDDPYMTTTPRAVILEPTQGSDSISHFVSVITSGKVIEIGDISATHIPVVHPRRDLFLQNAQYFAGAICVDQIIASATANRTDIRQIKDVELFSSLLGFNRGPATRLTIPQFRIGQIFPAPNPHGIALPSDILSGAIHVPRAIASIHSTNVFISPQHDTHNVIDQTIPMWSSYRFLDQRSQKWYWLPSLRPLFGTQARTFITEHPSLRIP